jgi:hypothetical protein
MKLVGFQIMSELRSRLDHHHNQFAIENMSRFNKDRDAASTASHSDTVGSAQGTALYKYRDFSHVSIEVLEEDARNESPSPPSANATETSIRIQKFPAKLYAILAQREFNNIITWMPHGRSVSPFNYLLPPFF